MIMIGFDIFELVITLDFGVLLSVGRYCTKSRMNIIIKS